MCLLKYTHPCSVLEFCNEATIMSMVRHRNIVTMYGVALLVRKKISEKRAKYVFFRETNAKNSIE
jgi:hypothetical protein